MHHLIFFGSFTLTIKHTIKVTLPPFLSLFIICYESLILFTKASDVDKVTIFSSLVLKFIDTCFPPLFQLLVQVLENLYSTLLTFFLWFLLGQMIHLQVLLLSSCVNIYSTIFLHLHSFRLLIPPPCFL